MSNPYNKINPLSFVIRRFGVLDGFEVFVIDTSSHTPFESCVFRDRLARFLFDELTGEFHLGNDSRFLPTRALGNNLALALKKPFDVQLLRDHFTVV